MALIYDPDNQIESGQTLFSKNTSHHISQQIDLVLASMKRIGERLGCSKRVLNQLLLDLRTLRRSTTPSVAKRTPSSMRRATFQDNQAIAEQSKQATTTRHDQDPSILQENNPTTPLLQNHAKTEPFELSAETLRTEGSEQDRWQAEPSSQPRRAIRTFFSVDAAEMHPFLLVEVLSGSIKSSALKFGCCGRPRPFVQVEGRVMKNSHICALKAAASTRGARNPVDPEWMERMQLDYPSVERAQFSVALYASRGDMLGQAHNFMLSSIQNSAVIVRKLHFANACPTLSEQNVLGSVTIRFQLVPNKQAVLTRHFESCRVKIREAMRAKSLINKFKAENSSFVGGAASQVSQHSQVAKIYSKRQMHSKNNHLSSNVSLTESKQQLNRMLSPSVISQGSFDSPFVLRRDGPSQTVKVTSTSATRSPRFSQHPSSSEDDLLIIPPND